MNTTNLAMNISAHSTLGLPIGPGDTGRVPDNTVSSVLWAKLVSKWDETTKPLDNHQLLFSFILNYEQAFTSWWVMRFGPGGSPLIMPHFPGKLRVGVSLGKPSSTEAVVTLVRWEVVRPGLPLSYQLQLRYAQAISCDEEGVMPAMDVGMGARPPKAEEACTGSPITVTERGTKGRYAYEDWGSWSNFKNMKQNISRRNNWPAAIRHMVQLTSWRPCIKIPAALWGW